MADAKPSVQIGYLEKSEPFKLESRFFPSKVGGKPAWLDLKNISVNISCRVCDKPCVFLCQVYAPVEHSINAYHRTLYVFVCRNPSCCEQDKNNNFMVLRCQLPKENEFYVPEEPDDTPEWHPESSIDKFNSTCAVCGCLGSFHCGKCRNIRYCCKEHQVLDWTSGHKKTCGSDESLINKPLDFLFPEYEIKIESELFSSSDEEEENTQEKTDEKKLEEYEKLIKEGRGGTLQDVPASVLEQFAECKEDKYLKNFKATLSLYPDQVIRYDLNGKPLWIAKPNLPEEGVPNCEYCQSPRQFEFQILSTLLGYLNVDSLDKSIDWGTLLVYTCKENCSEGPSYKKEFLWKQDY